MSLRLKIFFGFLLMAVLAVASVAVSFQQFSRLQLPVMGLPDNNEKVAAASVDMLEALDRASLAVLVVVSGDLRAGRSALLRALDDFSAAVDRARAVGAIAPDAAAVIDAIDAAHRSLEGLLLSRFSEKAGAYDMKWYLGVVAPAAEEVKGSVLRLMELNRKAMHDSFASLKALAERAARSIIVGGFAMLFFIFVFNLLINLYVLDPVRDLARAVDDHLNKGREFVFQARGRNEVARLAAAVRELAIKAAKNGG